METAVGAVRTMNVMETVITIAVPLVADLLRAWFVDSVELILHFALINLNALPELVINIKAKGKNE